MFGVVKKSKITLPSTLLAAFVWPVEYRFIQLQATRTSRSVYEWTCSVLQYLTLYFDRVDARVGLILI